MIDRRVFKKPRFLVIGNKVIADPLRRQEQPDGRVRFWGEVTRPGEDAPRVLRVMTLTDGETIHNAFFDRRFRKDQP